MRLPRLRLPRPRLALLRPRFAHSVPPDEDARLLRRTRLRLMGVSGLVTLAVLLVLGGGIYWLVASAIDTGQQEALVEAGGLPVSGQEYGVRLSGTGAGLFFVIVLPNDEGMILPRGYTPADVPAGLPDQSSLDAISQKGAPDLREITLPDGTRCRVYTWWSAEVPGAKVQWMQNMTAELSLLGTLRTVLLVGGLLALLLAVVAGYFYAGRGLVPIRESIDRRKAALQRQREFAANASHELRTPLTVIGASVEDLRRNRDSKVAQVGEALTDIDAEVRHMSALVEDLLLLARTDSGVVQIEKMPLDLGDLTVDAVSVLAPLGEERGVKLLVEPLPVTVEGDPLRLRQLVTILTDNAVRHSPPGSTVAVRVQQRRDGARLEVDDQGAGIKAQDLPRIFERFWRADDAPAGGTGLGLAIAKWIVEQHGGAIRAENRPEGGARLTVVLPGPGRAAPESFDRAADNPDSLPA